jgi:hypothetical protein
MIESISDGVALILLGCYDVLIRSALILLGRFDVFTRNLTTVKCSSAALAK